MRALIAHTDEATGALAQAALEGAGWNASCAASPSEVRSACSGGEVDVVFLEARLHAAEPDLVADLKRRPETFSTAVVLVADREGTGVAYALGAIGEGVQDLLLAPFSAAEVVARASAASRTRALVDELLERDERIEELVFVDELTGLYNRRYLLHHMGVLIAAARRHGHPLACVLLDIDRFKHINDTHGHPAGDAVLRAVAEAIRGRLRTEDVAGRLGGDEFLMLLPETDAAGAHTVAEGIRREVAATRLRAGERMVGATVSMGTVSWQGEDRDALLQRVDAALYAAKAAGRDTIAAA